MTITTFASMFTGLGGADIGAIQAGLTPLWGVENDPKIRLIAKANKLKKIYEDARYVDYSAVEPADWLHASPPCLNASAANPTGVETLHDTVLMAAVVRGVEATQPKVFSLENVPAYERFGCFQDLKEILRSQGYTVACTRLDARWYRIPQTRVRLVLIAKKGDQPVRWPSVSIHAQGWSSVIETAPQPEGKLSARMVKKLTSVAMPYMPFLASGWNYSRPLTIRLGDETAPTVTATMNRPSLLPWRITPDSQRPLTIVEMARLQSIPDSWKIPKTPTGFKAIGNAVPPAMMRELIGANIND